VFHFPLMQKWEKTHLLPGEESACKTSSHHCWGHLPSGFSWPWRSLLQSSRESWRSKNHSHSSLAPRHSHCLQWPHLCPGTRQPILRVWFKCYRTSTMMSPVNSCLGLSCPAQLWPSITHQQRTLSAIPVTVTVSPHNSNSYAFVLSSFLDCKPKTYSIYICTPCSYTPKTLIWSFKINLIVNLAPTYKCITETVKMATECK
jgi:hypothetical protein